MITKLINLNINEPVLQQTPIILNQANVNSVSFIFKIFKGIDEINYLDYQRVEMVFRKRDGTNIIENGTISKDGITYILNQRIFDIPDMVTGQINLYKNATVTSTLHYSFRIIPDLLNTIKTSESYVSVLEEMVAKYQYALNDFPNLSILGSFDTLAKLKATYPDGTILDPRGGFFVTSFRPPHYFYWDMDTGWTDIGPIQGEQGALWFNLKAATSTAPTGSRIDDIVQNVGTTTLTIGGVSMAIGDIGRITSLSPFAVVKEGNIRGATGATGVQGIQGVQGTIVFTIKTPSIPVGARIGDLVLYGGSEGTGVVIADVALETGDLAPITSLNPLKIGAVVGNTRGPRGLQGLKGDKGDTGPQGVQGIQGVKGDAATISVGAVTTGEAGSKASVTNAGTTSTAKFDFTIPKGDKGEDGKGIVAFRVDERGHLLASLSTELSDKFRINPNTGHLEYIISW